MEGIPITDETLNKFRQDSGSFSEETADYETATQQLNEVAGFLLKTADSALATYAENLGGTPEQVDKVQWSEQTRERVSELSVLVAKRNISEDVLRNSPELFLGSIVVGKIVEVGIVISQINKQNPQESKSESKAQTEDE